MTLARGLTTYKTEPNGSPSWGMFYMQSLWNRALWLFWESSGEWQLGTHRVTGAAVFAT